VARWPGQGAGTHLAQRSPFRCDSSGTSSAWWAVARSDDVPVPRWWPWQGHLYHDTLAFLVLIVIAAVVRWSSRSWVLTALTLVPFVGLVVSLVGFAKIDQRLLEGSPKPIVDASKHV
jgi:hypothetical protein